MLKFLRVSNGIMESTLMHIVYFLFFALFKEKLLFFFKERKFRILRLLTQLDLHNPLEKIIVNILDFLKKYQTCIFYN